VIYTLFNQFNCRVLDDSYNIFVRINKNIFFPLIVFFELGLQIILIQFGKEAFKVSERGLTLKQWGICIGFSFITFFLNIFFKITSIDICIQAILDNSKKGTGVGNIEDLEKNPNSFQKSYSKNNAGEFDGTNNYDVSGTSSTLKKKQSFSKGGSMRQKKADVNFNND
jgi:hypothetical protein